MAALAMFSLFIGEGGKGCVPGVLSAFRTACSKSELKVIPLHFFGSDAAGEFAARLQAPSFLSATILPTFNIRK
jgi:hypothetical protein